MKLKQFNHVIPQKLKNLGLKRVVCELINKADIMMLVKVRNYREIAM